jgi:hypothetical protein
LDSGTPQQISQFSWNAIDGGGMTIDSFIANNDSYYFYLGANGASTYGGYFLTPGGAETILAYNDGTDDYAVY